MAGRWIARTDGSPGRLLEVLSLDAEAARCSVSTLRNHLDAEGAAVLRVDPGLSLAYEPPATDTIILARGLMSRTPIYFAHVGQHVCWSASLAEMTALADFKIEPLRAAAVLAGGLPGLAVSAFDGIDLVPPGFAYSARERALAPIDDFAAERRRTPHTNWKSIIGSEVDRLLATGSFRGVLVSGGLGSAVVAAEARRRLGDIVLLHQPDQHTGGISVERVTELASKMHARLELLPPVDDFDPSQCPWRPVAASDRSSYLSGDLFESLVPTDVRGVAVMGVRPRLLGRALNLLAEETRWSARELVQGIQRHRGQLYETSAKTWGITLSLFGEEARSTIPGAPSRVFPDEASAVAAAVSTRVRCEVGDPLAALWLHDAPAPSPFSSPRVVEYALSQPPDAIARFHWGHVISHAALRELYRDDLPASIIMSQLGDRLAERHAGRRVWELRSEVLRALDKDSLLASSGVIEPERIRAVFATDNATRVGSFLLRALGLELYLRRLHGVRLRHDGSWSTAAASENGACYALAPGVQPVPVPRGAYLINASSRRLVMLDAAAASAVISGSTYPMGIDDSYPRSAIDAEIKPALERLRDEGWLVEKSNGEGER